MAIIEARGITQLRLRSLAITTPPTKLEYEAGEQFDPTGMVLTATYTDGSTEQISSFDYDSTLYPVLTAGDNAEIIELFKNGSRASVRQPLHMLNCFNDYSWNQIKTLAAAGQGQTKGWAIGDTKKIHLAGTVDELSTTYDTDICLEIAQFNPTTITLIGFMESASTSKPLALNGYYMSSSATHTGGYFNSTLRNQILGAHDLSSASTFMSCLPSDLRDVLKAVSKTCDGTTQSDYFYPLGRADISPTSETKLTYFETNSRIRYNNNSTSQTLAYWLREQYDESQFYCQTGNGEPTIQTITTPLGLVLMMEVGL